MKTALKNWEAAFVWARERGGGGLCGELYQQRKSVCVCVCARFISKAVQLEEKFPSIHEVDSMPLKQFYAGNSMESFPVIF